MEVRPLPSFIVRATFFSAKCFFLPYQVHNRKGLNAIGLTMDFQRDLSFKYFMRIVASMFSKISQFLQKR